MRVLVIEDEIQLAGIIKRVLERERYAVDTLHDGEAGLEMALTGGYDVIVLDRMLPEMDGLVVCRELREAGVDTPVLILSALRELDQRVEGLDTGADDYLPKPFAFEELIARVRALTRRSAQPVLSPRLTAGHVTLDGERRRAFAGPHEVELSPTEFALLELLMRNAGQALSRDQILERVWGYTADPESNVVDIYIHYLRRKLELNGKKPPIRTVRGVGYMIAAE